MKRFFTAALFVLFGVSILKAQNALPAPYPIQTDTARELGIGQHYIRVLMDKNCPTSIEEVLQKNRVQSFQPLTEELIKKLSKKCCFWYTYRIQNTTSTTVDYSSRNVSDRSDFYVFRKDKAMDHFVIGHLVPTAQKSGFKQANAFSLTLSPGETLTIYQKTYNLFPNELPIPFKIKLLHTEKLRQEVLEEYETYLPRDYYFTSFFAGILGLAFLLNILLFFQTKDKAFLWFGLFLLFNIFGAGHSSFAPGVFSFALSVFGRYLNSFSFSAFSFFLLFLKTYFQIKSSAPRWNRFLSFFIPLSFCHSIMLGTFPYPEIVNNFVWFVFLVIIVILVTTIICLRKPSERRPIFGIAILPFGIVLVFLLFSFLLIKFELIPNFFPDLIDSLDYIFYSCLAWSSIVFSAYLYNRYAKQEKIIIAEQLEKERLIHEQERERIALIEEQKLDLEKQVLKRTAELEQSLQTLQSTQAQLIQSEKLASLGELTAGIAHEIQNPLNFVNNFAEVSAEMLDEMHEELEKGDTNEAIAIATDLKTNLEKINHHGQRASSIVKGMLEHSRSSTGVKEPTDLNALADEYLRLAYHGLRAKDNNFNANIETHFDPDLPKVSVIPQDIGRVLLNLINNAFYAIDERQKQMAAVESGTPLSESFRLSESYTPTISIRTKLLDNAVEIRIQDNGNGIPEAIRDKIFQPFFTTKPTGQGTGLGLSLAYDIVTKGHGGSLEVRSVVGEGTEFVIRLS